MKNSEDTRLILDLATQECQRLNHQQIEPYHIFLAVVKAYSNESVPISGKEKMRKILGNNVDTSSARRSIENQVKSGPTSYTGDTHYSQSAQTMLNYAEQISKNAINPEHVLLGLLTKTQRDSVTKTAMKKLDMDPRAMQSALEKEFAISFKN